MTNAEYQREWHKKHPGLRAKWNKAWIEKNRPRYNQAKSEYRFKLKVEAITHYSNGSMACSGCGFSADIDALCLDHINNDGAQHRKDLKCSTRGGPAGTTIYERIKAVGCLPGLQVLCANCNTIKALHHKRGRTSAEMYQAISKPTRWKANV